MASNPKVVELPVEAIFPQEENTVLLNAVNGRISFAGVRSVDRQWDIAKDAVNYPVEIVSAYYKRVIGNTVEFIDANGKTNTGRTCEYNLVVADKYRQGIEHFEVIGSVTGLYNTIDTRHVYSDLQAQLRELKLKHHISELYISGTGGLQRLILEMEDMTALGAIPDDLVMRLRVVTSVDGKSMHTVALDCHNKTAGNSIAIYGGEYRLHARHTNTLHTRSANFIPQINNIIANWNDTIVPLMKLMYNDKLNRKAALGMLDAMAEESGLRTGHREAIRTLYVSDELRTNVKDDCTYRVASAVNQYLETEMSKKPELQDRIRKKLSKSMRKVSKRLTPKTTKK